MENIALLFIETCLFSQMTDIFEGFLWARYCNWYKKYILIKLSDIKKWTIKLGIYDTAYKTKQIFTGHLEHLRLLITPFLCVSFPHTIVSWFFFHLFNDSLSISFLELSSSILPWDIWLLIGLISLKLCPYCWRFHPSLSFALTLYTNGSLDCVSSSGPHIVSDYI